MSDLVTVVLTLLLLFVVLFYVYPLKFLFGVAFHVSGVSAQDRDVPFLFLIYGIGFAGVSLVLALLYVHAYRKSADLGLTEWERFVTRVSIADHLGTMSIGLLSAGLAQVVPVPATGTVSGFVYFGVGLVKFAAGWYRGYRARSFGATLEAK